MRLPISNCQLPIADCQLPITFTTPGRVARPALLLAALGSLSLAGLWTGCTTAKPPSPPPPTKVAAAQRAAEQAAQLSQVQNWPAAAREWQLAADSYSLLNDRTNEAIALHNLAQAQRELGQGNDARRLLEEAARLNHELGRTDQWWRNQIALLQLDAQAGRTNDLRVRFDKLFPQASQIHDRSVLALFLNELGLWQQRQGELSKAAETFRQAGEHFAAARDRGGAAAVLANQAGLYERQQNYPAAVDAWNTALVQFESLAEPRGITRALQGLGRTLLAAREDLPHAEELLRRAARNYRILNASTDLETTLKLLADCLVVQGKKDAAEAVRRELKDLGRPRGSKS